MPRIKMRRARGLTLLFGPPLNGHAHSTLGIQERAMELDQRVKYGSLCPRCDVGMMRVEKQSPAWSQPGRSEFTYRCSECLHTVVQVQDNRFV
jgi:hypothetical protein